MIAPKFVNPQKDFFLKIKLLRNASNYFDFLEFQVETLFQKIIHLSSKESSLFLKNLISNKDTI